MRSFPRYVSRLALTLATVCSLRAQVAYTGGTYNQNFDSLTSATIGSAVNLGSAGPISLTDAPMNGTNLGGWSLARLTGTTANALFASGTGSGTAGATYSFGALNNADRALGTLYSGGQGPVIGVVFTNNTGATITQFTLTYFGEQWRHGGSVNRDKLMFEYLVGAPDSNVLSGGFTAASSLDFNSMVWGATAGARNGNDNANRVQISDTITGLSWAPGQALVLRWREFDVSPGADDGLAIDDLSFTTTAGPAIVAPSVASTTPAAGATGLPIATPITVNFTVPTTVSGNWYTITGSLSGPHTATVLTNNPSSFTLVPQIFFAEGETVTVTLDHNQIVDTATGTAQMAADHVLTFTTQTTTPVPIHQIQGNGATSPYAGQVMTVQGIVTASFQAPGGLSGFYVQAAEADYDSDDTTSEGIFVFNTSFPVAVGDVVKVTGTVAEFGSAGTTQTEFTNVTTVATLATGAPLPAPVEITLPFESITFAERYEGMRATLPQTLTVTDNFDLGHFGELFLSVGRLQQPTNVVAPGAAANAMEVTNFLSQVMLDDAVGTTYPDPTPFMADSNGRGATRRAGSTTTGVTGIFDQKFGNYIVEPTAPVAFADANPRIDPPAVAGSLKVAIGNVLNYFNGNGTGVAGSAGGFPTSRGADTLVEYQRQRAKIIAGITALAPDIMGLTEVENDRVTNGLPDSYGPTSAIADLVNGLNAAAPAGTTYAYVNAAAVDIVTDVIHCAFIYRTQTVEPVGAPAMLNHPSFNSVARNPLAQTFRQLSNGEKLTISINHFKSKGTAATYPSASLNADAGDGQAESNYVRKLQAQALVSWLATDPTGSGDPDFLIIGDLNAYAKEDPITILEAGGYINLTEASEGVGGYSYAFGGQFGHLDHALANAHLSTQVADAATWHVNSDEPVYYDYNVENKNANQQAVNTGGAYRYSDHDPVVVGLNLEPDATVPSFTADPASATIDEGQSATFTVVVAGYPAPTLQWSHGATLLTDATGPSLTITGATLADAGTYSVVATNSQGTATSAAFLTVNDITPPVLTLPANQTLEATSAVGAVATFTAGAVDAGSGSVPVTFSPASGSTFALGTTTVTATATDGAGNSATGTFTVTVQDTTAPVITSLTATPSALGSPNHKMIPVALTATVAESASAPVVTKIISVTCNEVANGKGDGNTAADWEITGNLTLNLRAERSGTGSGRIYTITVESRDAAGNVSTKSVTVTVGK